MTLGLYHRITNGCISNSLRVLFILSKFQVPKQGLLHNLYAVDTYIVHVYVDITNQIVSIRRGFSLVSVAQSAPGKIYTVHVLSTNFHTLHLHPIFKCILSIAFCFLIKTNITGSTLLKSHNPSDINHK